MKGGVTAILRMGIDDEDFQEMGVSYSIWSNGQWVSNTKPFQNMGGSRKYYPYSLKIQLTGKDSEKYWICYKVSIRNQKDKTRNRESGFYCNGAATERADFEAVGDYIFGYEINIVPIGYDKIE